MRKQSEQGKKRRLEKYIYVGRNEGEKYEETPRFPLGRGGLWKDGFGKLRKSCWDFEEFTLKGFCIHHLTEKTATTSYCIVCVCYHLINGSGDPMRAWFVIGFSLKRLELGCGEGAQKKMFY